MRLNTFTFGILLTCAFASVTVGTHVDDVTQLLNGLASNVQGSINTASIVSCGTESIFASLETGILPILDEVASCNPLDATDIQNKITALVKVLPDSTKQCINNNAEIKKLLAGLGISGLTPDQVKSKITNYVMDNLLSICGTFGDLNNKFKGGDFSGFGTAVGKIALAIFKSSSHKTIARDIVFALMSAEKTSREKVADFFSGFGSSVNLTFDGTALSKCLSQSFADTAIPALTNFTATAATMNISLITNETYIYDLLNRVGATITKDQLDCFASNPDSIKMFDAFGLKDISFDGLLYEVIAYTNSHITELLTTAGQLNNDITRNDWNDYGLTVGKIFYEMIHSTA